LEPDRRCRVRSWTGRHARHLLTGDGPSWKIADLIILNKTDRVAEAPRRALLDTIGRLTDGTPVVPASHGRIDPGLLFDQRPRAEREDPFGRLSLGSCVEPESQNADERTMMGVLRFVE
jgi:G3E family GTPase